MWLLISLPSLYGLGKDYLDAPNQDGYIDIQNVRGEPQDLNGWMLRSEKGLQDCPLNGAGVLAPRATLRIWAMSRDAGQEGFNCGYGSNIWNNDDPDLAILFNEFGQVVAQR